MNPLTRRNERKHRRTALFYTILITASLVAAVVFSGHAGDVTDIIKQLVWPTEEVTQEAPVAGV
ncbi:MAG: hypothetical protein AAF828_10980 [Bacteroidota bacterium]